jgi:hypothetical protein
MTLVSPCWALLSLGCHREDSVVTFQVSDCIHFPQIVALYDGGQWQSRQKK